MKITITGAGGFVGKELVRHLSIDHQILALTHQALEITDPEAVRAVLAKQRPDLVINCAVIGVDLCEAQPALAQAVNITGPRLLAEACTEIDAEVMHLSTNYVFDGQRAAGSYYTNNDVALPINQYGVTKLAGEAAVQQATARSYIVRTSWVFGAGKDNFFSQAARALRADRPIRATDDLWASVTFVEDLVARISEIIARRHYATYHVVNEGCCSHYEFALEVARQLAIPDAARLITATAESEAHRLAARPRYTPMRCQVSADLGFMPLRHWPAALPAFLSTL